MTMSSAQGNGAPAPGGFWQSLKSFVLRTDAEVSAFKGLTFVGLLSTLVVAYFQYLSAYHDKVSAMAKEDMGAATDTFKETSNALSTAIILEDQLYYNFKHAAKLKASGDDKALTSKEAHDLYTSYEAASTALQENIDLLARKVEIYLDWASDPGHDAANNLDTLGADPISTSFLGAVDFDCDQDMPNFDKKNHVLSKIKDGKKLEIDWYSAKHHVLTIEYCFDVTQKTWMEIVRQWASQSTVDPDQIAQFASSKTAGQLQERLDQEIVRLNDFMMRAMSEIEQIRVKYRPNGFVCSVPGVGQFLTWFKRCTPIRTASP
jgi:hypothetical protein